MNNPQLIVDAFILLVCVAGLVVDVGIYVYVKKEYEESKELNMKLNKVYKSKKKKVNATQLVKAIVAQEAQP